MTAREAAIVRGTLGLADNGVTGDLVDTGSQSTADPFADDIVVREAAELPYGGEWKGKEGLHDLMTKIGSLAHLTLADVQVFDAGDGWVVARQSARFLDECSADELVIFMVEVYKLANDKIVEIDVYYKDTKAMVDFFTAHPH
jgi:hypothetical protein